MPLEQRIARLEHVLGTLISWITWNALRPDEAKRLLDILNAEEPVAGQEQPE